NPPVRESILTPLTEREAEARLGEIAWVDDGGRWARETFTRRQGYESWRILLAAALALLLLETWIAASGGRRSPSTSSPVPSPS
ncbi:MAG: hypothetical protein RLN75_02890, partial [Longimicrobiales bacterium]